MAYVAFPHCKPVFSTTGTSVSPGTVKLFFSVAAEKLAENEIYELILILKAILNYKYVTNKKYLIDIIKVQQ